MSAGAFVLSLLVYVGLFWCGWYSGAWAEREKEKRRRISERLDQYGCKPKPSPVP
jgi:hypothetical protein